MASAMTLRMLALTCGIALLSTLINVPHTYAAAIPREDSAIALAFAEENARIISILSTAFKLAAAPRSNPNSDSTSPASAPLPSSSSQSSNLSSGSDAIQSMLERRLPLIVEDIVGTPNVGEVINISQW